MCAEMCFDAGGGETVLFVRVSVALWGVLEKSHVMRFVDWCYRPIGDRGVDGVAFVEPEWVEV